MEKAIEVQNLHKAFGERQAVQGINFTVEKGESRLFDEVRYFFYITNDRKMTMQQIVLFANDRGNQENVIGQLKSGVNALRMPSDGLMSNWAYMVIAALAWNLKAWYGLVTLESAARNDILRMEFKRFLGSFVQIPCQIVATQLKNFTPVGTATSSVLYMKGTRR